MDATLADDIFKCIFLNENVWILLKISLKFVPEVQINNIPALVQIMAWRRPGDKPLSEPILVRLLTHIYASLGLSDLNFVMLKLFVIDKILLAFYIISLLDLVLVIESFPGWRVRDDNACNV